MKNLRGVSVKKLRNAKVMFNDSTNESPELNHLICEYIKLANPSPFDVYEVFDDDSNSYSYWLSEDGNIITSELGTDNEAINELKEMIEETKSFLENED